jgi:hypothetical protein
VIYLLTLTRIMECHMMLALHDLNLMNGRQSRR